MLELRKRKSTKVPSEASSAKKRRLSVLGYEEVDDDDDDDDDNDESENDYYGKPADWKPPVYLDDSEVDYYGKPADWKLASESSARTKSSKNAAKIKLSTRPDRSNESQSSDQVSEGSEDASPLPTMSPTSLSRISNVPKSISSIPGLIYDKHQIPALAPEVRSAVRKMDKRQPNWWERNSKYNSEQNATCAHVQIVGRHQGEWVDGEEHACRRCVKAKRACIMAMDIGGETCLVVRPARVLA